jgi:hypothetical protein
MTAWFTAPSAASAPRQEMFSAVSVGLVFKPKSDFSLHTKKQ